MYNDAGEFVSLAANTVGAKTALAYVDAPAGKFFLDVTSFCQSWEVSIEERSNGDYGVAAPADGGEMG